MTIDTSILEILNKVCDENDVNEEFKKNIKKILENWDMGKDINEEIDKIIKNNN
jgi:hypothetical protein